MFLMAGLLVIGLLCNLAVRPVTASRFRQGAPPPAAAPPARQTPPPSYTTEKSPVAVSKMRLAAYWLVVGIPLGWGVWKTLMKLPALLE
jgi:hypothetical protein